ncbi:hypothetical protein BDV19DRAFT_313595 [Aspergillus venezuelensis]
MNRCDEGDYCGRDVLAKKRARARVRGPTRQPKSSINHEGRTGKPADNQSVENLWSFGSLVFRFTARIYFYFAFVLLAPWRQARQEKDKKDRGQQSREDKKELGDPGSMRRAGTKKSSEMERAGDPVDGLESARLINHA